MPREIFVFPFLNKVSNGSGSRLDAAYKFIAAAPHMRPVWENDDIPLFFTWRSLRRAVFRSMEFLVFFAEKFYKVDIDIVVQSATTPTSWIRRSHVIAQRIVWLNRFSENSQLTCQMLPRNQECRFRLNMRIWNQFLFGFLQQKGKFTHPVWCRSDNF